MSLRYAKGDIFDSGSAALVNPVNCVGIMGKGLAKEFKKRFPGNFMAYKRYCDKGMLRPGMIFVFRDGVWVVNLATKGHFLEDSRMSSIRTGIVLLRKWILTFAEREDGDPLTSVSIPAIGCGLGNLDWPDVRDVIEEHLSDLEDTRIVVHVPRDR